MEHTRFVRYIRDNSLLSDFYEILSGILLVKLFCEKPYYKQTSENQNAESGKKYHFP